MLNVTEINKRLNAISSTLKDAPRTRQLVHELVASHLEAIAKIEKVSQMWLPECIQKELQSSNKETGWTLF